MEIKNLRKATRDYRKLNKGGAYAAQYALMYLDRETGEIWTNEYYDLGHNSYTNYDKESIVCLSRVIKDREDSVDDISEALVREYAEAAINEWRATK